MVCDWPVWNSRAVAFVTSLTARLCVMELVRASVSEIVSLAEARVRRSQSIIATRVLSPGASDIECRSWPRVRPCANQDWLKLSSAPVARR